MSLIEERPALAYVYLVLASLVVSMVLTLALGFSEATGAMLCYMFIGGGYVLANEAILTPLYLVMLEAAAEAAKDWNRVLTTAEVKRQRAEACPQTSSTG